MWTLLIVATVGVKPSANLQISYLIETKSNYFLISQLDTAEKPSSMRQVRNDYLWFITEPLGGIVGGLLLGYAGGYGGWLLTYNDEDCEQFEAMIIGGIIGCGVGSGIGIWVVGKYICKERGSLLLAVLGSGVGIALGCATYGSLGMLGLSGLPALCGLITYRLSLKL